jgi:hypothetical protein
MLRSDTPTVLAAALEEFRALYQLVTFRLSALDQRLPVTVGAFSATLISVQMLSDPARLLVLWATPPALVWLMRATVNHARSFEDALRRIEEIEELVNTLVGQRVLAFQSLHPSRGKAVGGRTGREAVVATEAAIVLLLVTAAYQFSQLQSASVLTAYAALLVAVMSVVDRERRRLSHYRYSVSLEASGRNR